MTNFMPRLKGTKWPSFIVRSHGLKRQAADELQLIESANPATFESLAISNAQVAAGAFPGAILQSDGSGNGAWRQLFGENYQVNFAIRVIDSNELVVGPGDLTIVQDRVVVSDPVTLNIDTAADWVGSDQFLETNTYQLLGVYVNRSGSVKLHYHIPVFTTPDQSSWFHATINQSTWTTGSNNGLTSTSLIYDNEVNETALQRGMLLFSHDSADSALAPTKYWHYWTSAERYKFRTALITDVNTSTNTLTYRSNHGIRFVDNQRIFAVPFGRLAYRYLSGDWWHWVGWVEKGTDNNLVSSSRPNAKQVFNTTATFVASTSWTDVRNVEITLNGGDLLAGFTTNMLSDTILSASAVDWRLVAQNRQDLYTKLEPRVQGTVYIAGSELPAPRIGIFLMLTEKTALPGTYYVNVLAKSPTGETIRFEPSLLFAQEVQHG